MKSVFISICGAPNAGKSTLTNYLVGQKISIVSPKIQTTRDVVRGIITEGDSQIVLLDTPGIFKPKGTLEKFIVKNAHSGIRDAEIACLIIDGKQGMDTNVNFILHELKEKQKQIVVAINKVDEMSDNKIIKILADSFDKEYMLEIFPISAKTGQGVQKLKDFFFKNAKKDVWYYDENDITDKDIGYLSSEISREKIFLHLEQELPYNIRVVTDEILYEDNLVKIAQTIYVNKQSQKNIVIGKKGSMIAQIVNEASIDMKELFGLPVKLKIFVKVEENWISRI